MVSAQVPCLIRLYHTRPNGNKTIIVQKRVEQLAPAGGASEGAPVSVSTPEKLLTLNSNEVFVNDDFIEVSIISDGNATLTASKCIWSIPLLTQMGDKTLGRAQFQNPSMLATPNILGATETILAGYRITEGQGKLLGKIYLDIQDDS